MTFSVNEKLPGNYFTEVMDALIFSPYCGNTMATFKFYSYNDNDDSPVLYYTFSNLGDLEDQLDYFWLQFTQLLEEN